MQTIPLGWSLSLGDGAELFVMAANGKIFQTDLNRTARNENDKSISLYIKYGRFDYVLDGDLGAGTDSCVDHQTSQKNFQGPVAAALIEQGRMDSRFGVDVMHVSHHGAESSTSAEYFNMMRPEIAVISVGVNQAVNYSHPREDVVDNLLLHDGSKDCISAPAVKHVFQTEEGLEGGRTTVGRASFTGTIMGDISIITDGVCDYTVTGTGIVANSSDPLSVESYRFELDDLIDLNTAELEILECLPGIGVTLASRIIEHRRMHPFGNINELQLIEGIGSATFNNIRDMLVVE